MQSGQQAAGAIAGSEHADSERRYTALIGLAQGAAISHDWSELARSIAQALDDGSGAAVRDPGPHLRRPPGPGRMARRACLPGDPQLDLTRAAREETATVGPEGTTLVGLHADGVTLGVLHAEGTADTELLAAVAPLVACRFSVLASQGVGDVLFAPQPVEQASNESAVISDFAHYAKRRLDHDRLSVYLTSPDGRAFERFAVATSPIVPGEGVLIPFEDVGLKHIVLNNEPLVSSDIGADPRIGGREDRVIAQAGFRGLLSVPLRRRGRPFGVLNFVSREPGFYHREDVPVAQEIADQIAIFVENLRAPAPDAGPRPPGDERGRAGPAVPRRLPHGRAGGTRDRGDRFGPRGAARVRQPGERVRPADPQAGRGRARAECAEP